MNSMERLYNKYFNNRVDKLTLSSILAYGGCIILLSLLLLTGSDGILKSIVNSITESISSYVLVLIGMIPVVRYYQIILGRDVLEEITAKSYSNRILDVVKLYIFFAIGFIVLLIIHRVLLPVIIMVSNDDVVVGITDIISYTFISEILSVSFLILLGSSLIGLEVFKGSGKSNLFIMCIFGYIYVRLGSWLTEVFLSKSDTSYILISTVKIIANITLTIVIGKFIINNIGKVKLGKS